MLEAIRRQFQKIPFQENRRKVIQAGSALPVIGPQIVNETLNQISESDIMEVKFLGSASETLSGLDTYPKLADKEWLSNLASRVLPKTVRLQMIQYIWDADPTIRKQAEIDCLTEWSRGQLLADSSWHNSRLSVQHKYRQYLFRFYLHSIKEVYNLQFHMRADEIATRHQMLRLVKEPMPFFLHTRLSRLLYEREPTGAVFNPYDANAIFNGDFDHLINIENDWPFKDLIQKIKAEVTQP